MDARDERNAGGGTVLASSLANEILWTPSLLPRLPQHREVGRERRLGTIEVLGDLSSRHRLFPQELQDSPPRRIGQRLEDKTHISMIS